MFQLLYGVKHVALSDEDGPSFNKLKVWIEQKADSPTSKGIPVAWLSEMGRWSFLSLDYSRNISSSWISSLTAFRLELKEIGSLGVQLAN